MGHGSEPGTQQESELLGEGDVTRSRESFPISQKQCLLGPDASQYHLGFLWDSPCLAQYSGLHPFTQTIL